MKHVVLFDIDGTLLLSHGSGRVAMESALIATFGTAGPATYRYDGKTDKLIVRETMRAEGFTDEVIDARMPIVLERYLDGLHVALADATRKAYALPGIHEIVNEVERADDLVLGLLTGNVMTGARAKLRAVELEFDRFVVGAFGSDHEDRPQLPPIARARECAARLRRAGRPTRDHRRHTGRRTLRSRRRRARDRRRHRRLHGRAARRA